MSEFKPGDRVVYRAYPDATLEAGVVKEVKGVGLFVLFEGDLTAKLTPQSRVQPAAPAMSKMEYESLLTAAGREW